MPELTIKGVVIVMIYWVVAFSFSAFYGRKALKIFTVHKFKDVRPCARFHYFWQNFIGSFVGWAILYYLIFLKSDYFCQGYELTLTEITLFIITIVSITGFLPHTLSKISSIPLSK